MFEEHPEFLDLVELGINDDELSYCCEKSVCSSFVCNRECSDSVAFDDEMFEEVVFENQSAFHNKFYDDYSHVVANPLYICENISEGFGVVSEFDNDFMCEYKLDYSCEL